MGRKVKTLLLLVIVGVSLCLPGASAVDSRDYEEALKEDEQVDANQAKESSTEYPNGVNVIPGQADIHYPIYSKIEKSSFSCAGRLPGFYADSELRCQVWHICDETGVQQSFLCTNGTIYSQDKRVCDWWYNVNCDPEEVSRNYEANAELYKGPPPKDGQSKTYEETNDLPPPPPRKPATPPPQHKPQPQPEQARQQNQQRHQQQHDRQQQQERPQQQRPNYDQEQQGQNQNYQQRQNQPQPQQTQHRPQPHPQRPNHEQQQQYHQAQQHQQRSRPQQQQNYEAPTPRRQPSSAPQQNSNQAPPQPPAAPRPQGAPAPPPGGPEKKRVIVLRLPGPLPPGATIPPHLLMEYAESVLAAERAGKPPPPGLVSSETVTLRPTTTTPPPAAPAQPQPGRVRPTPRGPIVPYTPRSFAAFLEDASRLNGQTKTKPAPPPPKPPTTTPPPVPQRAPTGQYQEAPRRPQQHQHQQQQQYQQQTQRTPPPPPPPTQPRTHEEPQSRPTQPPQQKRYEEPQQSRGTPPPQQQRRYEGPRPNPPSYESQPASYNQDASYEQQQAKQEEPRRPAPPPPAPVPQQKKPVPPPKPVKSHVPAPHSEGKKFRHSTPRKHGEVRFAPKSALAVEDLEEFTEESRRPAYFNNLQHVPYLSPDVSTTSTTNSPKKSDVHLKTSFENFEKVRPQRVKQLKTAFEDLPIPTTTSERYLTQEEIVEPAIKRLVVAAGLKIKDPRGRPTTTPSSAPKAGSSEEEYQSYKEKNYEPVRVIVTRKQQTPSPPTTPESPTTTAHVDETTPKVVMRRVIRKKIRKNSNSTSPPVQVAEQAFTRVYHHSARQPSLIPVREDPAPQVSQSPPTTAVTRRPTTTTTTTTTSTTPVPYNDGEQEYFEPEYKPFKNYGFDVYGRTEDEEEEELVRAAQEYYQASEYYGRKQRNA